jgi:hypothetical protein
VGRHSLSYFPGIQNAATPGRRCGILRYDTFYALRRCLLLDLRNDGRITSHGLLAFDEMNTKTEQLRF